MATLTDEHKRRLTIIMAEFTRPTEAARMMKEEFGVEIDRVQAAKYDATGAAWQGGEDLAVLFRKVRAAYVTDISAVPCSQQAYRLRTLQRQIDRADDMKAPKLVADLLKQAAEEMGGVYTNLRHVHPVGSGAERETITPDDARAELAMRLAAMAPPPKKVEQPTVQ